MIRFLLRLSSYKLLYSVVAACLIVICIPAFYVGNDFRLRKNSCRPLKRALDLLGGRDPGVTLAAFAHRGLSYVAASRLVGSPVLN